MTNPWLWLGLALVFGGLEVMTFTFVLVFFALGAFVTGLVAFAQPDPNLLMGVFGFTSFASLFGFRSKVRNAWAARGGFKADENRRFRASDNLAPKGEGKLQYQGTLWTVQNISSEEVKAGSEVEIVRSEGNRLIVTPVKA